MHKFVDFQKAKVIYKLDEEDSKLLKDIIAEAEKLKERGLLESFFNLRTYSKQKTVQYETNIIPLVSTKRAALMIKAFDRIIDGGNGLYTYEVKGIDESYLKKFVDLRISSFFTWAIFGCKFNPNPTEDQKWISERYPNTGMFGLCEDFPIA